MSQQGLRQASFRAIHGETGGTLNEDMLKAFAAEATIPAGATFNEAFMLWLQTRLSSSTQSLSALMQEFADDQGVRNWASVGSFDPAVTAELVLIDRTAGTNIGDMTGQGGLAAAFDGTTTQAGAACAGKASSTSAFVGKTLASAKVFGQAVVHGSSDSGYVVAAAPSTTITIYGKEGTAPASATDGTPVGSITFTDLGNESTGRTIESTDLETAWDHLWATLSDFGTAGTRFAELVLYEWA